MERDRMVIDMRKDTVFVLEEMQDFLVWLISQELDAKVVTKAEELIDLIHIKEEIILHEGQQKALIVMAKEKNKIASEIPSEFGKTETERYFMEAAKANNRVLSNGQYLEELRRKEFEKILTIIQNKKKNEEGEKKTCS